jgi:hypothetical protein
VVTPTSSGVRVPWSTVLVGVLGLGLFVVSVRQVGWGTIEASVRGVGLWLAVVVALGLLRMVLRSRAWVVCARQVDAAHALPLGVALEATIISDALGNLTPLGLLASEPTKIVLARRHLPTLVSLISVTVENVLYTVSVLGMLLVGVWVLLQRADVPVLLERMGEAVVVLSVGGGLVAVWAFRARPAVLSWLAARLARGPASRLAASDVARLEGHLYDVIHWPLARLLALAAWEAGFHVAAVAEVWVILRAIPGVSEFTLADAFVLEAAGRFITVAFKFVPYRLGVDEVGSGSVAQVLGLGAPVGVALAIVRRVRILLINGIGMALMARRSARVQ